MIQKINFVITKIFDVILVPFTAIGDFWGILFLSLLTSLVVLVIYKYFSSPKKIRRAKDRIKANILAIRLYKDSWKVIVGSFFKSLFYVLKYFALNFGVVIIIMPLLFPLFVQMDVRYGMRPFRVGEEIIIKAAFTSDPNNLAVTLLESKHFKPQMNPVFINAFKDVEKKKPMMEVNWKAAASETGATTIRLKVNDKTFGKSLLIGTHKRALSNKKFAASTVEHFIYPVEDLFAGKSDLKYVYINYPGKSVSFLGLKTHWLVYYLVLTLIIVLALRKKFGVEF
ncbi:MAG: hypothetical protein L0Y73_03180 [Candidatus Aminicenantes bacterium]|nr:hypothetical protein [Candidatus Aminicenantes bacterium]